MDMLDKILEAFTYGTLQDCANIKLKLDEHNISWEDFLIWMKSRAIHVAREHRAKIPVVHKSTLKRKCPGCENQWLRLDLVNHHPAFMVEDNVKCQWYCPSCGWDEYSDKDILEEAKPYIVEL